MADGYISDIKQAALSATAEIQAKNVADILHKHYPGHLWAVNVDEGAGLLNVYNLALSGSWGFTVKLNNIDADGKNIMRFGGELLERYRIARGKVNWDHINEIKRDGFGNKVFERI